MMMIESEPVNLDQAMNDSKANWCEVGLKVKVKAKWWDC